MYQYTEFDHAFVHNRAAQFRDQLERWQSGKISEEEFRPLRLPVSYTHLTLPTNREV